MNKHILIVMKWLADKDSVSQEELKVAYDAYCAAVDAYDAACYAYAAYAAAYRAAAYRAADAACAACFSDNSAVDAYDAVAANWVDKFFKVTGENKDDYIAEISK
jgi:hypothetical protein